MEKASHRTSGSPFSEKDLLQIQDWGKTPEEVLSQIAVFERGFPHARLRRPCTAGDGIRVLDKGDIEGFLEAHGRAAAQGRIMKFVPASGAASRMFKALLSFYNRSEPIRGTEVMAGAERGDKDSAILVDFIYKIKCFAFYNDLESVMAGHDLDVGELVQKGEYTPILEYTLTPRGLNLAHLPKGLIPFHVYPDHPRTPIEEHLVEAAVYARDRHGRAAIHFTVSPEHVTRIQEYVDQLRHRMEGPEFRYEVTCSLQKPSTDTIAVDMENKPFRDKEGKLLFRPGGHGALLENLNDLQGDIIFIKNIDNVVPDRLKEDTYTYKKALAGCLIVLQDRIFQYLRGLSEGPVTGKALEEMVRFAKDELCLEPPKETGGVSTEDTARFLTSAMNRPLRVCGMVRNVGEPGGGPFWVEDRHGTLTRQIVESSQVDMQSPEQQAIWKSATHFNPVDLVCGVHDFTGRPFDLRNYIDPLTGFISVKSLEGKDLKALELPGLWNGSMARWNTVFVEVPISTFNPVKTVMDLLRKEHQPARGRPCK